MIALEVVAEIRRLLTEEKLSQRKTARLTGVSRSTIAAIGSGKRPDYELLQRLREDDWEEPTGPAVRCPGCGNRVYMPCQLCRLRKRMAEKRCATGLAGAGATGSAGAGATGSAGALRPRRPAAEILEPLGINLRPEHRVRYEEVRAWRISGEQSAFGNPALTSHTSPLASQGA